MRVPTTHSAVRAVTRPTTTEASSIYNPLCLVRFLLIFGRNSAGSNKIILLD